MLIKLIIGLFLIAILYALFSGLYFLLHDSSKSRRLLHALTWRVSLQFAFIVFLAIAYFCGWIHPHGL